MVISVDWLQLHYNGTILYSQKYIVKRLPFSTRHFKYIDDIYINDNHFCTITHTPLSSILDEKTIHIKISNEQLYTKGYLTTLDDIVKPMFLQFKGFSRLDICCDFNTFCNNRLPSKFIESFFKNKIEKVGFSKFKAFGEQKKTIEFDYLRFGTNNSIVSSYVYNKSKELREVKNKSYIVDTWLSSGLDVSKDVWRLEFSVKGSQLKLIDSKDGSIIDIKLNYLLNNDFMVELYYSLLANYFRFKKKTSQRNKTRNKDIQLFISKKYTTKRYIFKQLGDGTKADKMFIKRLENLNNEMRAIRSDLTTDVSNILVNFVYHKGLTDFYMKKINGVAVYPLKRLEHEDKNTIFRLHNNIGQIKHTYQLPLPFNAYSLNELRQSSAVLNGF